jgi:hypothetical protein
VGYFEILVFCDQSAVEVRIDAGLAAGKFTLDRRDLDAAWHRAHTALETLPRT